ncbi:MAG: hypothetical protein HYX27_05540 [Acidobacteria bacterium]|nr:hypothetical protein [Acidobacteriota bacterium]
MAVHSTLVLLAAIGAFGVRGAEVLDGFRPSTVRSDYGAVSEVEFSTRLVVLDPGMLAHHVAGAMKDLQFSERVWLIGYKSGIVDEKGREPRENFLCHTFFADQRVDQHDDKELKGIYSDAFTPEVRLPEGFGIPFAPGDPLHWMPMFNNRGADSVRVGMKVTMTVIREKDLKRPLRRLYANLRSVQAPHLYFVSPGHDERKLTFVAPYNGRIHFLGTHLHPFGTSIELYNESKGERVWVGRRKGGPESPMEVYSSVAGYAVREGERFRVTAVYENPTADRIDAMAGLFILYERD